jgi:HEPN domain-containing protein
VAAVFDTDLSGDCPGALQSDEEELARIVRIIFDGFERAIYGGTSSYKRSGRILRLIELPRRPLGEALAGVEEDRHVLVIVNKEELTDRIAYWSATEDRLDREHAIMGRLGARVRIMVRSLNSVNRELRKGSPFFARVVREGRRLYPAEGFYFAEPVRRPVQEAGEEAAAAFHEWFGSAERRLRIFDLEEREGRGNAAWRKDAAFTLHQAVERLYSCVLLTRGGLARHTHRIDELRSLAEALDPALAPAWPRQRRYERRCFTLLQQAYVGSRYWPHYAIGQEDLAWLGTRTRVLRDLVVQACSDWRGPGQTQG